MKRFYPVLCFHIMMHCRGDVPPSIQTLKAAHILKELHQVTIFSLIAVYLFIYFFSPETKTL